MAKGREVVGGDRLCPGVVKVPKVSLQHLYTTEKRTQNLALVFPKGEEEEEGMYEDFYLRFHA